jgi:hypothetical protein
MKSFTFTLTLAALIALSSTLVGAQETSSGTPLKKGGKPVVNTLPPTGGDEGICEKRTAYIKMRNGLINVLPRDGSDLKGVSPLQEGAAKAIFAKTAYEYAAALDKVIQLPQADQNKLGVCKFKNKPDLPLNDDETLKKEIGPPLAIAMAAAKKKK